MRPDSGIMHVIWVVAPANARVRRSSIRVVKSVVIGGLDLAVARFEHRLLLENKWMLGCLALPRAVMRCGRWLGQSRARRLADS